ncbi:uracil-DNA glycosylase [Trichonephila inaurata madagascariensis]|uniref:Uracil-DNA glycosylase n=1 Tax=Trichonephila inaurata madagascariensis TaxID=2747483 RepID=A0A8X6YQJ7_9ARAC|nr:uracil-DNA glycosylase [Trichonephila inaurata madagascariensis]
MSQKLISSFLKPKNSGKRKFDEIEDQNNYESKTKKNGPDSSANERAIIIETAKKKPALSPNIGLTWFKALEKEFAQEYFERLSKFLIKERSTYTIYPPEKDVYSWTNAVKIDNVKVVILGQDPYHGPNQAHGLAFSVRKGVAIPKSLVNIYNELSNDIPGFKAPLHGCLYGWASQGVLLLNTCLSVRAHCPLSHQNQGWENFTDAVIKWINLNLSHVVFLLWGGNAKKKSDLINKKNHLILTAAHPSPLSAHRGFLGCRHFSKTNEYLQQHNKKLINWAYLP